MEEVGWTRASEGSIRVRGYPGTSCPDEEQGAGITEEEEGAVEEE